MAIDLSMAREMTVSVNAREKEDHYVRIRDRGRDDSERNLRVTTTDGNLSIDKFRRLAEQVSEGKKEFVSVPEGIREAANRVDIKI